MSHVQVELGASSKIEEATQNNSSTCTTEFIDNFTRNPKLVVALTSILMLFFGGMLTYQGLYLSCHSGRVDIALYAMLFWFSGYLSAIVCLPFYVFAVVIVLFVSIFCYPCFLYKESNPVKNFKTNVNIVALGLVYISILGGGEIAIFLWVLYFPFGGLYTSFNYIMASSAGTYCDRWVVFTSMCIPLLWPCMFALPSLFDGDDTFPDGFLKNYYKVSVVGQVLGFFLGVLALAIM